MYYIFLILLMLILVLASWALRKRDRQKTLVLYILEIGLVISLSFNIALYDANKELRNQVVEINDVPEIQSFSIPEEENTEIIEPILTPSPTPVPVVEVVEEEPVRYEFTENDIYLMARLLCGSKYVDGDGEYDFDYGNTERYDQISLVLCVVMNRVRDERFPDTVEGVVTQKYSGQDYQFSAVSLWKEDNGEVSDIAIEMVTEWCEAYNRGPMGSQSIPESYVYFSANGKGINVARPRL